VTRSIQAFSCIPHECKTERWLKNSITTQKKILVNSGNSWVVVARLVALRVLRPAVIRVLWPSGVPPDNRLYLQEAILGHHTSHKQHNQMFQHFNLPLDYIKWKWYTSNYPPIERESERERKRESAKSEFSEKWSRFMHLTIQERVMCLSLTSEKLKWISLILVLHHAGKTLWKLEVGSVSLLCSSSEFSRVNITTRSRYDVAIYAMFATYTVYAILDAIDVFHHVDVISPDDRKTYASTKSNSQKKILFGCFVYWLYSRKCRS